MNGARACIVAGLLAIQGCAAASVGAHRYLASGAADLSGLTLARESPLAGSIGYETHLLYRHAGAAQAGWMAGVGLDGTVLSGRDGIPYVIGGVQVGTGTKDHPSTWSSWSLGLGAQVLHLGPAGLRVEGRYRQLSAGGREGLELGLRLGRAWRTGSTPRPGGSSASARSAAGVSVPALTVEGAGGGAAGALRVRVVSTAMAVMGTPYRWGGTDANGFDCSGLIQYAYREAGIELPRRSADQALAGVSISRDPTALLPGDILTFATTGVDAVSHVGLYLGEGRFIHSATGGVQISVLSGRDPYGRWWFQRWVGVRRVTPG